jgi:hypothetical protein
MFKVMFVLLCLSSVGLAQSSADGTFSVHHVTDTGYSLRPAEMREAESIYHRVCAAVQHEFHRGAGELHPQLRVVIGAERNEVHSVRTQVGEIWMKKWDPITFAQGVVVLAFDQMLTHDVIVQLGDRGFHQSNAAVDVADLSKH